ncbi:lipopolysaccharide heptosyltransferase family protein [Apibacter muscae]|uniref:Lipopolysaccharide heptosyltransferase family protein n=1 Tax=Apibacter muscae TaxID=2509004 RepID=A0A563DDF6_9FLAO|nr:glycosyltransferase family 9 protein [Apibacter muscae]TWP27814.1 lipopolysaccharide heptosyltransferase family protein [Apibacter muscae]TWP29635.1 lipopolysaccharide heptosyltransferase family protein [Apibacter muscae]
MSNLKKRLLVFRFSAMGDVAMTVPVLKELALKNLDLELIIISRDLYKPFFESIPNSVFVGVDFNNYKGVLGLFKLSRILKKYKADAIVDLHNVLRTKILKFFLRPYIKTQITVNKGRNEKKLLASNKYKILKPLKSMHERYADVFRKLGFNLTLSHKLNSDIIKKNKHIGIAPFANYKEKMYTLDRMKKICLYLANKNYKIYLFGGGTNESNILKEWSDTNSYIHSLADNCSIKEQMEIMKNLEFIITMDSANMHIASIAGTRVISIWGATHPFAGFLGYGQKIEDVIQIDLSCRPCSIYGNKSCLRKDIACMNYIDEKTILSKILNK